MNKIICYNVIDVTQEGITLECKKNRIYVRFDECAKNFALESGTKLNRCVGTRDITTLSFEFYTQPKVKLVFKNRPIKNFIKGKSSIREFVNLQKAIVVSGYTSYDLS